MESAGGSRIGRTFKRMSTLCPLEIASYGKCLASVSDAVDKNICAKEFEALKACFRKARPTIKRI